MSDDALTLHKAARKIRAPQDGFTGDCYEIGERQYNRAIDELEAEVLSNSEAKAMRKKYQLERLKGLKHNANNKNYR